MNWERDQKERDEKLASMCQQAGSVGCNSTSARLADEPARLSLRERVAMDLDRARREMRKRERLEELSFLLDKNPEIARILELVEDLRQ